MKVGFIGLGLMGSGMVGNLQKAGHDLVVHDLRREAATRFLAAGAAWAESPRALAEVCDVVLTSLPTPADVETVGFGAEGLAQGFRSGAAWFDLSTNSVEAVRGLNARLARQDVAFLDAPVSGGPAGAASGRMAIWVGGDRAMFDRHLAVLEAMGDRVRHVGPIGAATVAKLTHNAASVGIAAVLAEVITMGVKAGVEPLLLWDAIRQGALGRLRTFDMIGLRMLPGRFDPPNFELRLVHKDISVALELARQVNVPMRLCTLVQQEITEALNRGWAKRDSYSFVLLQQERAGISPIEVPIEQVKAVQQRD